MLSTSQGTHTYGVSEFTRDAKTLLESHFDWLSIEGELGDFTAASSGHWYFTLKDSKAQVRCAMFRRANAKVAVRPQRGDHVRVRARVSLYEARGEFQLICEHLAPAGDGALQLAFERLKQRLLEEGLFASERKQTLPADAQSIGVITSTSGAAIHDILSVLERRSPRTRVLIYPVTVQGAGARDGIAAAIRQANTLQAAGKQHHEALIVGRGGGSLEDLWPFNEEIVARAIADSAIPVVSAVGHEVDFTIADFVADYRAPTPSAAAEILTIEQREWQQQVDQRQLHLTTVINQKLTAQRHHLEHLLRRLRDPALQLSQQKSQLGSLHQRLKNALRRRLDDDHRRWQTTHHRLQQAHPGKRLRQQTDDVSRLRMSLHRAIDARLRDQRLQLDQHRRLLETLGPANTLKRGYAIVTDSTGRTISASHQTQIGEVVTIRLASGSLGATIDSASDSVSD